MLKALELVGFKSFADKTRFDFPEGITVVVGPNGSGKSNIVDAIKWVLGAQSAKSLRGADMADVIFKGSAAGGRKAANSAEATLVFDNEKGLLPVDATEVHVTRRVYRSGESEYLINRNPCRLKDVKDLFRGTGVGVDAYSLIEQGKVDRMLQASPKDRRVIFEEAAGISRFKAKRVEAQRRLDRVDQNLVRLKDIVEEVRVRYETLQNQAEKARRYREMVQKLSLMRTQIGLAEQAELQARRDEVSAQSAKLSGQLAQFQADVAQAQSEAQQVELLLQELAAQAQSEQERQSNIRQEIVVLESQQEGFRSRGIELDSESQLLQTRLQALRRRAELTADEVAQRQDALTELDEEHKGATKLLQSIHDELHRLEAEIVEQRAVVESRRIEHVGFLRQAMEFASQSESSKKRTAQLEKTLAARNSQIAQVDEQLEAIEKELNDIAAKQERLQSKATEAHEIWATHQAELESLRQSYSQRQSESVSLQGKLEGTRERLTLLEQLEQQQEGVGRGARQVIELAKQSNEAPWTSVRGLVADLIEIDMHLAPLVDVALGNAAETVVLADGQLVQLLRDGNLQIDGRISLLRMDRLTGRKTGEKIQLDGLRGVIGRADRMVKFQPDFEPLIRFLLGTTWLVDTLSTALDLSHFRGAGLRFVTASCERIDADGTLTLGSLQSALGIVARRSEMQTAREEIKHFELTIRQHAKETLRLQEAIEQLASKVKELDEESRRSAKVVLAFSVQVDASNSRQQELATMRHGIFAEQHEMTTELEALQSASEHCDQQSIHFSTLAGEANKILEAAIDQAHHRESDRKKLSEQATAQRVEQAKIEQRIESLRTALEQLARDHDERHTAVADARQQLAGIAKKRESMQLATLEATSQLASLYLDLETVSETLRMRASEASRVRLDRQAIQKRVDSLQRQCDKCRDRFAQVDSELKLVETNIVQLRQRMSEDYQIDLQDPQLLESTPPLENRAEAETLVARLKADITQVGDVNMEALRELDELQSRYETLRGHYQDLTESRDAILKIIAKINQDSRRVFLETLEAIRQNFQLLYRKSFGGGTADIILEEGEDVLECGVEIVATPPGKTALSNSLLSGGEKALTAVALIMAIFQFRPSPFCVLDEVDAPFDEANIGRFVTVLKEFLHWTKFIVVTHSKKTMTAANTLYGVTMQESGVSKQVAVRFEDVGDDGEILSEQPTRKRAA
jgi:chromosome segregation protein